MTSKLWIAPIGSLLLLVALVFPLSAKATLIEDLQRACATRSCSTSVPALTHIVSRLQAPGSAHERDQVMAWIARLPIVQRHPRIQQFIALRLVPRTQGGATSVPEPGTFGMLAAGLLAVGFLARRRRLTMTS